ncbi:MAG: radical SAM protein [Patescibacteria group bacterium]|nr:radical SAM protein [Patescibacteria group bacterium]
MKNRKLILKKESFGGLLVDTKVGQGIFLNPEEYESKKQELLESEHKGYQLKIVDVTERGYPLLTNATSTPDSIFWELTKRCDGSCADCFMDSNAERWDRQEVNFREIENIVRQFSDLGGYSLRLTGGEPTLRKDFFDIVDLLNEEGIITGLNTNGFFGKEKLESILSRNIKDIRISVDGPEKVNDSIRGRGSYRKAIRTISNIAEYNKTADEPVQLIINFVLMKRNMEYIEEMIGLACNYNSKISFGLLRLSGRAKREEMLSPEEVVRAAYKVQQMRTKLGLAKGVVRVNYDIFCGGMQDGKGRELSKDTPFPFDNSKCPLACSGFTLDAYARIVPCGYLVDTEEWIGDDVRGKDLLEIWHNSPILNKARNATRQGCIGCGYHVVKCNGGCPAMAYFLGGDINGKDPYCVKGVDVDRITKTK